MLLGWLWVAVIALAITVEIVTDQLISIWFVPGAIVAIILDFVNVGPVWQVLAFLVVSGVGIIISQKYFRRMSSDTTKTNIEAIIGERCIVTERIDNFAGVGQAKVKGQLWSARGVEDDDVFEPGEILNIVAIEGVKLICKKV